MKVFHGLMNVVKAAILSIAHSTSAGFGGLSPTRFVYMFRDLS